MNSNTGVFCCKQTFWNVIAKTITIGVIFSSLFTISCVQRAKYKTGEYKVFIRLVKPDGEKKDFNPVIKILTQRLVSYGIPSKNMCFEYVGDTLNVKVDKVDDPKRIVRMLSMPGNFGIWETYELTEIFPYLVNANQKAKDIIAKQSKNSISSKADNETSLIDDDSKSFAKDYLKMQQEQDSINYIKENPLFALLILSSRTSQDGSSTELTPGPLVGNARIVDTSQINKILRYSDVSSCFPRNLQLKWQSQPNHQHPEYISLIAVKTSPIKPSEPIIDNSDIAEVFKIKNDERYNIQINMNQKGTQKWRKCTQYNLNRSLAIIKDGEVIAHPMIMDVIESGKCIISANFSEADSDELVAIIKSGFIPFTFLVLDVKEEKFSN